MQRYRILHTLPDLALGGGQVITLRHLTHRDESTFDVRVVYLGPPVDLLDAFADTGVRIHRIDRGPNAPRALLAAELARLYVRERIDLVHVHGPLDREVGLTAAALTRVPAICQIHSEYLHFGPHAPSDPTRLQLLRARATGALRDGIEARTVREYVADSPAAAALFRPHVRQLVTAMSLALPLDEYASAAASHDDAALRAELGLGAGPVLLCVSRLVEGKGQERLVANLPRILERHPDAQLVLVGDGDRRGDLERQAATLGVAGQVHFLGPRHDVPRLLQLATLFVFGSRTEGLGVSAAEAMGAGLPVVAYRLPALDDYSTEGVTGFYPEQDDDAGFVEATCRMLDDPARAREMGRAGTAAVSRRFHPAATALTFEDAYRRVLGLPPRDEPDPDVPAEPGTSANGVDSNAPRVLSPSGDEGADAASGRVTTRLVASSRDAASPIPGLAG